MRHTRHYPLHITHWRTNTQKSRFFRHFFTILTHFSLSGMKIVLLTGGPGVWKCNRTVFPGCEYPGQQEEQFIPETNGYQVGRQVATTHSQQAELTRWPGSPARTVTRTLDKTRETSEARAHGTHRTIRRIQEMFLANNVFRRNVILSKCSTQAGGLHTRGKHGNIM